MTFTSGSFSGDGLIPNLSATNPHGLPFTHHKIFYRGFSPVLLPPSTRFALFGFHSA
ncbi:MAG: hypothetical protein QY302_12075 [Anaerolineales bacterium]|nr:MAG: hypothetical protein QY302_12075 [Anaerolineales bacterium]